MNFDKLYLYYGVMAKGWKVEGFKETFMGKFPIGPRTLEMVEDCPTLYKVRPILKPFPLMYFHVLQDAIVYKNKPLKTRIVNLLKSYDKYRSLGYDCDNLLDSGLAIPHKILYLL